RAGEVVFLFERALALTKDQEPSVSVAPRTYNDEKTFAPSNGYGSANGRSGDYTNSSVEAPASNFQPKSYRPNVALQTAFDNEPDISTLTSLAKPLANQRSGTIVEWLKNHKIIASSALIAFLILAFFGVFFVAKTHLTEKDTILVAD